MKSIEPYKEITLELYLFLGINFFFLLSVVIIQFDIRPMLFVLAGLTYSLYLFRNFNKSHFEKKFFFLYFSYLFLLLFNGIINDNFKSYIYADLFSFGSIIFIFISGKFNKTYFFTKVFPYIGVIVNKVIIGFVVIYIYLNGMTIASMEEGRGLDEIIGKVMSPKQLMYGSLLLYPLSIYLKKKTEILIYDLAMSLFLFFSLAMASRGSTVVALIIFLMTILERKGISVKANSILNVKVFRIIIIIILSLFILYQIPKIGSAIDFLIYRFTGDGKSISADRTEETEEILKALTTPEFIMGKGLGAANIYWIFDEVANGVNNVHYGWMFLILKGGVILLVIIYGKIILSILNLWNRKLLKPYSFILIGAFILEFSHTTFTSFYLTSFIFIAIAASNVKRLS